MDIKIGLSIKDENVPTDPTQFGVALAGQRTSENSAEVHIEGYGFQPSGDGARDLLGMLKDVIRALELELNGSTLDEKPRLDAPDAGVHHNVLDEQCRFNGDVERNPGGTHSGAARCPVCRPVRPRFNPQPVGGSGK